MKRQIFERCLKGAPIGLATNTMISVIISLIINKGSYYPVVPELIAECGSEMNAVLLQAVCSLLYGALWGGASIIWEIDNWSLLRQTVTNLLVCSIATFPVAYFMHWMDNSISGVIFYFSIFFAIYFIIWTSKYLTIKKRIQQINLEVQKNLETNQ